VAASFTPSTFTLAPTTSQLLTVKTNVPVGVATDFTLACTNAGNFVTVPLTVTIPAERDTATFTLTASSATTGTSVLTLDAAGVALTATASFSAALLECTKGQVVLSQVYGGGGNTGATYRNDFIELFNRSGVACRMTGWTAQYQSGGVAAFSTTAATTHTFTGTIPAHGYFLLAESAGPGGVLNLPTADATGTLALSGTAGKVLLMGGAPVGVCPATSTVNFIDLVDYNSTATCAEGTKLGALSNTTGAVRKGGGCTDTDVNLADFDVLAVNGVATAPRNSPITGPTCP
jgi:hypothetical protein